MSHYLPSPAYPPSSVINQHLPSLFNQSPPAITSITIISHHLPSLLNHHLPSSAYPPSSVIINHHLPSLFNQSPPTITVQSITTCHHQYTITSHNHCFKTAGTPPWTPRMHTFKSQRHKAFHRQFQGWVLLPAPAQAFHAPRQSACFCTLAVNTQPHVSIAVARQDLFPCQWPSANCFHSNYSPYCLRTTGRRNSRSLHLLSTQMCNLVVVSSSCRHTLSRPAQTTTLHSELPCLVSTHPVLFLYTLPCLHTPCPVSTHPALFPHTLPSPHTLSCLHTPCPVSTHPVLSPHTLSCLHTPCPVSTHPALSPHTLPCLHTPCHVSTPCSVSTHPALSPPHPVLSPHTLPCLHTPCPVSTHPVPCPHTLSCLHVRLEHAVNVINYSI